MCLSKVYLDSLESDTVIEEVSYVIDNNGALEVNSLFGERMNYEGFVIKEVNLVDNYIILKKREH